MLLQHRIDDLILALEKLPPFDTPAPGEQGGDIAEGSDPLFDPQEILLRIFDLRETEIGLERSEMPVARREIAARKPDIDGRHIKGHLGRKRNRRNVGPVQRLFDTAQQVRQFGLDSVLLLRSDDPHPVKIIDLPGQRPDQRTVPDIKGLPEIVQPGAPLRNCSHPFGHFPAGETVEFFGPDEIVAPLEKHELRQQGRRNEEFHRQRIVDVARLAGFVARHLTDALLVEFDHVVKRIHRPKLLRRFEPERQPLELFVPIQQAVERQAQLPGQDAHFPYRKIHPPGNPPVDGFLLQAQDVRYAGHEVRTPGHFFT